MAETALIIEVPESEFLVGDLRTEFDETASIGVPAHITVLYPFIPESELTETVQNELGELASSTQQCAFQLVQWCRFDTALWLRPFPEEPFRNLTFAIWRRFPSYPPYGGQYEGVQPHLTVAQFDAADRLDSQWDAIEKSTISTLPIDCVASALSVFVCNDSGHWKRSLKFPFSNATGGVANEK